LHPAAAPGLWPAQRAVPPRRASGGRARVRALGSPHPPRGAARGCGLPRLPGRHAPARRSTPGARRRFLAPAVARSRLTHPARREYAFGQGSMPVSFPSLAFFQALQREMRAERERFSRLGFFDTIFGVRILPDGGGAPAEFSLAFEVFDCVRVGDGLANLETDFVVRFRRTMKGDLELSWMDEPRERVRCRPQNERRGLTFRDLDMGTYGFTEMPELIRQNRSFAPRGAAQPPGLPDLQAEVNRKSEVWAYNIEGYYEEAMTRQWNATTDIPWAKLQETELPEEIGKAYAQLLTFLTEVEMIATDVPAKWMGRLNADFFEVKNFIATQAMDEARHAEIFRKRALSTGWGLMRASAHNEFNLKFLRDADSFAEASLALHLQAEGMVLTLFRFSEYISPTEGDKKLFRLVMQDEARHVGYGMQHLKWVVDHFPAKRELIHHPLDEAKNFVFGAGYATEVLEPFIILSGKGLKKENVAEGARITMAFQVKQTEEYFERLAKCGLPERRERSRLWRMFELQKQQMGLPTQ